MALSSTEKSLCNKLNSDFNKLVEPGKAAKKGINNIANNMKSKLNGISFSGGSALDDAIEGFMDSVSDALPGDSVDDLNKIKEFIDGCDYLKDLNPVSAIIGTIDGIFNKIDSLINSLDTSVPEFSAGGLGSLIDKALDGINLPGGDKISDLLSKADKLLNCLNNSCASVDPTYIGDLSTKTDELQQVYEDLGIVDDPLDPNYGKFDYSKMYNETGMTTSEIEAIDKTKSAINMSKDMGVDSVSKTINAIKSAKKGGFF